MDATEGTSENASQRVPDGESETVNEMPPRPRTCGSCRFWDVRIGRSRALENSVAYCALPQFSPLHLVVSGSSGCDRWTPQE